MAAVSDSSPLILYAGSGRLDLLGALFWHVFVPSSVWREVVVLGEGRVGAAEVRRARWIVQGDPGPREMAAALSGLDAGEADAIRLAAEMGPEPAIVLLDDFHARRVARDLGLVVTGSGGLLVRAKEAGLIGAVRPLVEELRGAGLYLGAAPLADLLHAAGEL